MAATKQPASTSRIASWNFLALDPGASIALSGPTQVVERIVITNGNGTLFIAWNGGSSASIVLGAAGNGAVNLSILGRYNYDLPFTIDASLVLGARTMVEFVSL